MSYYPYGALMDAEARFKEAKTDKERKAAATAWLLIKEGIDGHEIHEHEGGSGSARVNASNNPTIRRSGHAAPQASGKPGAPSIHGAGPKESIWQLSDFALLVFVAICSICMVVIAWNS